MNKNKKNEINPSDQAPTISPDLGGEVKLDPNSEIESGPEEKLITTSSEGGIVFSGVLKKDEAEKPLKNIISNINAESQSAADATYERVSFSGNKKAGNRSISAVLVLVCLFMVVATSAAFYIFVYKKNIEKKESPQEILNSSMVSMRNAKTYSSAGTAGINFIANDKQSQTTLDGKISLDLAGKADASDINNPKSQYNAKIGIKMKSAGGSEDFSADIESIAIGQKTVYYKINDFDLGAYGIMMGSQITSLKNKWYSLDADELKELPGYDESNGAAMENYDVNKIMDIFGKYEILKFNEDLGNQKIENVEVYHYKAKLDGMAIFYMYIDLLKEVGSKNPDDFGQSLSNMKKDVEENYRDLINEGFQNTEAELWIGKDNRYVYRILINGKLDEKYINKFMNITLGSARAKAEDAKIQSNIYAARPALEIYFDENNGSYENYVLPEYSDLKPENVKTSKDSYVVWSELNSTTDKWCVDSSGASGYVLGEITGFSCPPSVSSAPKGGKKDPSISEKSESSNDPKVNIAFSADLSYKDFEKPVEINKPEGATSIIKEMSKIFGPLMPGAGSGKYNLDSDSDGLTDDMEKFYGTDINNPDTDGDGYKDGAEVDGDFDPLVPGSAKLDYEKLFSN